MDMQGLVDALSTAARDTRKDYHPIKEVRSERDQK